MRRTRTALAAVVGIGLLVGLAGCTNPQALESLQRVNDERAANGLPLLQQDDALAAKAQAWAEQLAATRSVRHSVLTNGLPPTWRFAAENVGSASSVAEMHSLLMGSPGHRANILDGRPNRVGTGAAFADGRVYVVQVFAAL